MIAFINSVLGLFGLELVHKVPAPVVVSRPQVRWTPDTQATADYWRDRQRHWLNDTPFLGNELELAAHCGALAKWHDNGQLGPMPVSPGFKSKRETSYR